MTDERETEDEREVTEESRREGLERSVRPDIQAGALRMAEGDEPHEHEHPSYRETAADQPASEDDEQG